MVSDGAVEEVKARLDIVEHISDYLPLKKAGHNYRGLCPFHPEKTPSFMVSREKQIFHCFGCGAGGDIIGFTMKQEGLTFPEALRLLAKKAGVEVAFDPKAQGEREALRAIQAEALRYYRAALEGSREARAYLKGRGVTGATSNAFSLGYAPRGWQGLHEHLKGKGYKDPLLLKSGLFASGNKGVYDTFRDRIMFPIFDLHGEAVAFGGRVMGEGQPKYLNSSDTSLFKKGETLYALEKAKEEIRKKEKAVVVEGYMDAIMCHQAGIANTVAPLGTALTAGHLKKLSRYSRALVLVFDGDQAGLAAARRALPLIFEHEMKAELLALPKGEDPDSLLRGKGREHFASLLEGAGSPVKFILGNSADPVNEAVSVIAKVRDPILRGELIMELADRTGRNEGDIREKIVMLRKGGAAPEAGAEPSVKNGQNEEMLLLSAAIQAPERIPDIMDRVALEDLRDPRIREIFEKLATLEGSLQGAHLTDEERALVSRLSLHPGFDVENIDRNMQDCIRRITRRRYDERIRAAEKAGDLKLLSRLLTERQRLMQEAG
jgi:DNA primase